MVTKAEIIEKLTQAGIEHDPDASKAKLEELLPQDDASESEVIGDVEVGDPLQLRPVDLPLVVKPAKGGEWENEAQDEYAKILNAYAYKNPAKWAKKKGVLVKQLNELATNPEKLAVLKGEIDPSANNIKYADKRIQR